jgi:hypothetical protein
MQQQREIYLCRVWSVESHGRPRNLLRRAGGQTAQRRHTQEGLTQPILHWKIFIKGTVSRDEYIFWEGLNILFSTFCIDNFNYHSAGILKQSLGPRNRVE